MTNDEVIVTDPAAPIGTDYFSMDAVVDLVRAAGIFACVAQTGGGTATIFAGQSYIDNEGDERYPSVAGPGYYSWGHGPNAGSLFEFVVGPDDEGVAGCLDADAVGCRTIADIARLVAAQAGTGPGVLVDGDTVESIGLDATSRSSHRAIAEANAIADRYAQTHNAALHAAYARGASSGEAIAAAKAATDALEES